MSGAHQTFGRRALDANCSSALLALEAETGAGQSFAQLDRLLAWLLQAILSGEDEVVSLCWGRDHATRSLRLTALSADQRALLDETYGLERQRGRGAWFLPATAKVQGSLLQLPFVLRHHPRFATIITADAYASMDLGEASDVVYIWSILEPLFGTLLLPFDLRSRQATRPNPDKHHTAWQQVDALLDALGFAISNEYAVMRWGSGWQRLRSDAQQAAKEAILDALARQVTAEMGAHYRAYRLLPLLRQYYRVADAAGRARRQRVLTKELERSVAGIFGGNWLAFLDYIGEEADPNEQIVTALPETRLFVGGSEKAAQVAAQVGLPVSEVEKMVAAFWQQEGVATPIEQRTAAMERYWRAFDDLHARQRSDMKSLWGLVEDVGFVELEDTPWSPRQPQLYRELLPADVLADIERLWRCIFLPQWPDRIVSHPFAHHLFAETFGPALSFWHGCALTAWFVCMGPYSRSSIRGLAQCYRRQTAALADRGTPVPPDLFHDLTHTATRLNLDEPEDMYTISVNLTIGTTERTQSRLRKGFKELRDIITAHRRTWASTYLSLYLRGLWESDLRTAAGAYHQLIAARGKAPTLKQFAKPALTATNHWFGGDISGLYRAIGEKCPTEPTYIAMLPTDVTAFARTIATELSEAIGPDSARDEQGRLSNDIRYLATSCVWYVQVREALGRAPTLREFGKQRFEWAHAALGENLEHGWERYAEIVERVLARLPFRA